MARSVPVCIRKVSPRSKDIPFPCLKSRLCLLAGIPRLRVVFRKIDRESLKQWQIKAIEPDHGAIAFVAMIVPLPRGSENHITAFHGDLLPFYGSESFLAFHNETECECTVAVCWCNLARVDDL